MGGQEKALPGKRGRQAGDESVADREKGCWKSLRRRDKTETARDGKLAGQEQTSPLWLEAAGQALPLSGLSY